MVKEKVKNYVDEQTKTMFSIGAVMFIIWGVFRLVSYFLKIGLTTGLDNLLFFMYICICGLTMTKYWKDKVNSDPELLKAKDRCNLLTRVNNWWYGLLDTERIEIFEKNRGK